MRKNIYLALAIVTLWSCRSEHKQEKDLNEVAIPVSTTRVKSEIPVVNLKYSGTIEPIQTIALTFQTTGRVEKVLVDVGDKVKKDQLLAMLDKTDLKNLYDIANAKYLQAKDAYDRLKTVHDQGSLPEIQWVEMETNMEQAKLSRDLSEYNLDKCNLRAPADGVIGRRNIEPGMSSISIVSAPLELVDINTIMVKVSVPENEIGKIKKGLKAEFSISALNNQKFEGIVSKISPVADAFSRTYEVKIESKNPGMEIKPGMVCDVTLRLKSDNEVILIPYQCASKDTDGNIFVYLVDANTKTVKKQIIQTGIYYGEFIEVLSGLKPEQTIVYKGIDKLSDNCLISL